MYAMEHYYVRVLIFLSFVVRSKVRRNDSGWRQWFDKDAPEENPIPDGYETSLDTFRKLLLVRLDLLRNTNVPDDIPFQMQESS